MNTSTSITNRYGIRSFLRSENNMFFLVDSIDAPDDCYLQYYARHPLIKGPISYEDAIQKSQEDMIVNQVKEVCETSNINILPIDAQNDFLEASLLADRDNIRQKEELRRTILSTFSEFYDIDEDTGVIYNSMLQQNGKDEMLITGRKGVER